MPTALGKMATLHFCPLCDKPFVKGMPSIPRVFEKSPLSDSSPRILTKSAPSLLWKPYNKSTPIMQGVQHLKGQIPEACSPTTSPSIEGAGSGSAPTVATELTGSEDSHCTAALKPFSGHTTADNLDNGDSLLELANTEPYLFQDTFGSFDGSSLFDDLLWDHPGCSTTAPTLTKSQLLHVNQASGWCTWTQRGLSFAVDVDTPLARNVSSHSRPEAQRSADLVIQALRAFPVMMRRRETLPWFIHPYSSVSSLTGQSNLPDAISACMGIAQMLASSTPETKPFLWRTIGVEYTRLVNEMPQMSAFESLAAQQACMVYLIMCIVDYSSVNAEYGQELTHILFNFCVTFKDMFGGHGSETELANPSLCWEDWVFAESRRRMTILWLLIGCAACVKTGGICDSSGSTRNMPLPGPKSIWEATSQTSWETEYAANRTLQMDHGLLTVGDLIDTQNSACSNPASARKLDCWNAGIDNAGFLANLIGCMV
ncbi:hypothetical protein PV08_01364 [Exophiala spinifera]|uniref:Transcription factor domain-containing protein n=1 Tax=Exophiala spinifera TaxID=91928 RepID=A0A0D1YZP0_9EURO|nr:uncharacterized protein PV08_01364 [Exophiala spinifera]KIW20786.1 hypothetical protein PV08_01364 [Exophiala spinifera]